MASDSQSSQREVGCSGEPEEAPVLVRLDPRVPPPKRLALLRSAMSSVREAVGLSTAFPRWGAPNVKTLEDRLDQQNASAAAGCGQACAQGSLHPGAGVAAKYLYRALTCIDPFLSMLFACAPRLYYEVWGKCLYSLVSCFRIATSSTSFSVLFSYIFPDIIHRAPCGLHT